MIRKHTRLGELDELGRAGVFADRGSVAGDKPKRNPSKQKCEVCGTILNSYNLSRRCYLHQPIRYFQTRGRSQK